MIYCLSRLQFVEQETLNLRAWETSLLVFEIISCESHGPDPFKI